MSALRFADFYTAAMAKEENLRVARTNRAQYTSLGEHGGEEPLRDIEQRVRNLKDSKIRRMLEAVPDVEADQIADGWAVFMAVFAGRHVFPDANHRTSLSLFNNGLWSWFGKLIAMTPTVSGPLTRESKQMRDPHKLRTNDYYSLDELKNPNHPYRRLFASYVPKVIVVSHQDLLKSFKRQENLANDQLRNPTISETDRILLEQDRREAQEILDVLAGPVTPQRVRAVFENHPSKKAK